MPLSSPWKTRFELTSNDGKEAKEVWWYGCVLLAVTFTEVACVSSWKQLALPIMAKTHIKNTTFHRFLAVQSCTNLNMVEHPMIKPLNQQVFFIQGGTCFPDMCCYQTYTVVLPRCFLLGAMETWSHWCWSVGCQGARARLSKFVINGPKWCKFVVMVALPHDMMIVDYFINIWWDRTLMYDMISFACYDMVWYGNYGMVWYDMIL